MQWTIDRIKAGLDALNGGDPANMWIAKQATRSIRRGYSAGSIPKFDDATFKKEVVSSTDNGTTKYAFELHFALERDGVATRMVTKGTIDQYIDPQGTMFTGPVNLETRMEGDTRRWKSTDPRPPDMRKKCNRKAVMIMVATDGGNNTTPNDCISIDESNTTPNDCIDSAGNNTLPNGSEPSVDNNTTPNADSNTTPND